MLGEIVGVVVAAASPVDEEFAVVDAIFDPIKAHVYSLDTALFDGVVGNAGGTGVVGLDWGG